jgi:SHS2 domain-containing protein
MGFKHLGHTADVLIKAWGKSLEELFEQAAKGMFEVITDTSSVEPREGIAISICGFDLENALYKWLEELLFYHDSRNLVFSSFRVSRVHEQVSEGEKQVCVEGVAEGEEFQQGKHEPRTVVKAVTYHEMKIWSEGGSWYATFVVDI